VIIKANSRANQASLKAFWLGFAQFGGASIAAKPIGKTEDSMTPPDTIRRYPKGSLDVDFYRAQITARRGWAYREARTLRAAFGLVLTTLLTLCVVTALALASRGESTKAVAGAEPHFAWVFGHQRLR